MGVHIEDNKLIITESKTIYFDLPKDVENSLKDEIDHKTEWTFSIQ